MYNVHIMFSSQLILRSLSRNQSRFCIRLSSRIRLLFSLARCRPLHSPSPTSRRCLKVSPLHLSPPRLRWFLLPHVWNHPKSRNPAPSPLCPHRVQASEDKMAWSSAEFSHPAQPSSFKSRILGYRHPHSKIIYGNPASRTEPNSSLQRNYQSLHPPTTPSSTIRLHRTILAITSRPRPSLHLLWT
ncbi:hypothetical protein AB205_0195220 [Aquarana catesbeiana]|uniref:Uncharacterized protein n=1 Tax=Aquarana catesbeiana TaxID=8400 RepID=A0A2G9RBE6_AQUCT|nr:hypothetical protein AB205_0195220 [Aquarana catesbeiana]PIO25207.1 hypothetical protein AB205_0195220 [Aquarana catesbeiana]